MLDLKAIRTDAKPFFEALKKRNASIAPIEEIVSLDAEWRQLKGQADTLKAERNKWSEQISAAKKAGKEVGEIIAKTGQISAKIKEMDAELAGFEERMNAILLTAPNVPHQSVPVGKDEKDNKEIRKWGKPAKTSKDVRPHYEIFGNLMDFERGVKLSGSRFTVLYGQLASLQRALGQFMLENAVSRGYLETSVPLMVNAKTMTGSGQLPKFASEAYHEEATDLWMIPTSEVPLVNLHAGEVLEEKMLPKKYCALTPCFRKEAGNYQKDIKGMIRQHQFEKVELIEFAAAEKSFDELETLTADAEDILRKLQLPYRTVLLCTADLGFASAKTYDIEVWLPSQDAYREISSCSNCTDFQARRAGIKLRRDGRNEFVHTLNGSGLAVGRTLVAILENYQDEGGVEIPKALRDYMKCERIEF